VTELVTRMPRRASALAYLLPGLAIAAVYAPVLAELVRDWARDPNYSHGFLVPVVSAVLLWQRRTELAALPARPSWWGLVGILGSLALLVLGTAGAEVFTQRVSLVTLLASLVLFLSGWPRLRRTAFPLAFLLLAIPLPYVVYYGLTQPLQGVAARAAVAGLNLVGILTVREGNIIHLPGTSLEVAEACSGIRSLYAFLALGALLARSLPVPGWARWLVFAATIPLSVVGNALRVWGTGVAAHLAGPAAAEGTVHEMFGLFVFAIALVVLALVGKGARSLWSSEPS
jgi:exosortase